MKHLYRLLYPPSWPITVKLALALLSVAIVPMSFASYYNLQQSLENAQSSEYRKLELLAASNAGRLNQLLVDIKGVVVQISTEANVINFLAATTLPKQATFRSSVQQKLDNVFRSNPDYDAVYLLDKQGRCVAATDPVFLKQTYNFREYFHQAIQGRSYISGILVGKTTKRPGLYLSSPVRGSKGEIVGVAVIKIRAEKIWAIVNSLQVGSQGYAFLIDQDGVIISHPNRSLLYRSLATLPSQTLQQIITDKRYGLTQIESLGISKLATVMVGAKETGHTSYESPLGKMAQMIGFAPLEIQPWVLGVTKPKDQFAAPLNRLIWQNIRSVLAVGTIAAIVALLLARGISKPIRMLTSAAQALEQDDFDPQSLTQMSRTQDDMGQLVRVFMHMASEVKAREQRLKQQVKELHIEIDETKRAYQVAEVTGTEYFQQLLQKAQKLRSRAGTKGKTETDYFEQLQHKVQRLKERAPALYEWNGEGNNSHDIR